MFCCEMVVRPTIAFIGVRISWLIEERKFVFAEFAVSRFFRLVRSFLFSDWKNTMFITSSATKVNNGLISSDHWTSV